MTLEERLYWDTIAELLFDDLDAWELAWRANTLAGETSESSRSAASNVLLRLAREGLAEVYDSDSKRRVTVDDLAMILGEGGWAAVRPTVRLQIKPTDTTRLRADEMPQEAKNRLGQNR